MSRTWKFSQYLRGESSWVSSLEGEGGRSTIQIPGEPRIHGQATTTRELLQLCKLRGNNPRHPSLEDCRKSILMSFIRSISRDSNMHDSPEDGLDLTPEKYDICISIVVVNGLEFGQMYLDRKW